MSHELRAITMPKFGMAMEKGKLVDWLVEVGDSFDQGDEILEVETEKATNVVEAEQGGTLLRQVAAPDQELPVGTLIGVQADGPVDDAEVDQFISDFQENFIPEEGGGEGNNGPTEVQVDGISLSYQSTPGPDGATPILFIHGFGGDQNSWAFTLAGLAQDHPCITVDLPGHGASSKQADRVDLGSFARLIADLMDQLGLQSAHIVGHSLGGAIAVELACKTPDRVTSLTLISSIGAGTQVDRDYVSSFIAANRRGDMKKVLGQLFAGSGQVRRDMVEDVLKVKRMDGVNEMLGRIAEQSIFSAPGNDPAETLKALPQPVQIIWGAEDRIATVGNIDNLQEALPVHVIGDAGHLVHLEAAKEVNALISDFTRP